VKKRYFVRDNCSHKVGDKYLSPSGWSQKTRGIEGFSSKAEALQKLRYARTTFRRLQFSLISVKRKERKPFKEKTVLVLRTVAGSMTSPDCDYAGVPAHSFLWPESGPVSCSDWSPEPRCGKGLHGLLWGQGDPSLLVPDDASRKWLVIECKVSDVVELGTDKCKFSKGAVVFCGDRTEAVAFLQARAPAGTLAVFGTSASGDSGTSASGNYGTSTSGHKGTSTSGICGTSLSGNHGTSTSGVCGTSTSGDSGTSTSGNYGISTSGNHGTSTSGYGGTSLSGDGGTSLSCYKGTSLSGDGGTSTSGSCGTSLSGDGGTSMSGENGIIAIRYHDKKAGRSRLAVGYPGEKGIEPNKRYKLNDKHEFVLAE
jgi:hypothetical protein